MGLSPQAKPCETMPLSISSQMPQLFGEFSSFPISPLGQPTAWRLEGSFCSPKSRHHPLLTQFSFLGDTTQRDPSAQPSSSGSHCLHGPSDGPLQDRGKLCSSENRSLEGQGKRLLKSGWGRIQIGCAWRGGQSTQVTGFQLWQKGPRALALHPCWVSQQA